MSVPPCMTDSNQTKNNFNVGTYRRISRPSKGPYYKKFRAQPSPEIFLAHLLKNTWKCLVWKYERWGVLGQGLFWRFCKKNSKKFHKNWSSLGSYWSISKFFLRGWTADQVGHFGPTNRKISAPRWSTDCTLYIGTQRCDRDFFVYYKIILLLIFDYFCVKKFFAFLF